MLPLPLPDPRLCLDRVELTPHAIALSLHAAAPAAPCPGCAQPARQVHSHYTRPAHDLAIQGRATVLRLTARRFFCRTPGCTRRIFCQQFPALLARHAQATTRLHETHRDIGMALGGQPGARLAKKLGMPTSPDTMPRLAAGSHGAVAGRPVPRADRRLAGGGEPQRGGAASAVAGRGPAPGVGHAPAARGAAAGRAR